LPESASEDVRVLLRWVIDAKDNDDLVFLIVDKKAAKVFAFDKAGQVQAVASVLLGFARGDDTVPGIGDRPLASIRPAERTTPAGRFVSTLGQEPDGEDILWVDYESAVSLHRVVTSNPKEHRLERLASPTPLDNRISYGCINVPVTFYEGVVRPAFLGTQGIVYILPEVRSLTDVFPMQPKSR
jgi:hypothetical protein